jgi:biotin operon repressor
MQFDGATFDQERDGPRLSSQLVRVQQLMMDGHWRTLEQIAEAVGSSEAGVSARLRDLRKLRFGGYQVDRQHLSGGLFRYRVRPPAPMGQQTLWQERA